MPLPKRYQFDHSEPDLQARWQSQGIYQFEINDPRPVYSIDTPPATVSGHLHIGHIYSYSHVDFMARYFRMRGYNVFYPMGFDDNGLPTERFVERKLKVTAPQIGRQAFIAKCLEASVEAEKDYRAVWDRLGLSIDWHNTYRTIDEHSRRCSQYSFLDLYKKGLAYTAQAPMIWCPECRTAIAQAELEDRERTSEFVTLPFRGQLGGEPLLIATTRPELLAACVAVFVHPQDPRYQTRINQLVQVPFYGQFVKVLPDPGANPQKGTGAVMCCTFGDQADVAWWYSNRLPLIEAVGEDGRMLAVTGPLAGFPVGEARQKMKELLDAQGLILDRQPTNGTIRVHERCESPVEFIVTRQWFIRVLENKQKFLELGQQIHWHPANMLARYQAWVENLNWDWCISRQRYYGVPFPVWYCAACGEISLAETRDLPVDPAVQRPSQPCQCGSTEFIPDPNIMDTWATSSVSPEIVTGWLDDPERFARFFPMTLRGQAYEIIRTWTFDTIVKSWYHFGKLPWSDILISGWALAGEGMQKISKSKGGGPKPPMQMIQQYSADAVRYWAASTSPGKDQVVSEEKIQMGTKLVTKLWNVARFAEPFIIGELRAADCTFSLADRWILASLDRLVERVTAAFESYEYALAKNEIENFFWRDLSDNYLEMAKLRLYDPTAPANSGARFALKIALRTLLKLLAPLMPYITDEIWGAIFADEEGAASIHCSRWPEVLSPEKSLTAETLGNLLIAIASAARRYKSENALSLGSEINRMQIVVDDLALEQALKNAQADIISVTRARLVEFVSSMDPGLIQLNVEGGLVGLGIMP